MSSKRFKTRGFLISFGDIMLPLIGVVAIGLLLVAGRFFFMSDFHSAKDSLPVMTQAKPAQARESGEKPADDSSSRELPAFSLPSPTPAHAEGAASIFVVPDVLAIPYEEQQTSISTASRTPDSPKAAREVKPSTKTQPKPRPALPPKRTPPKQISSRQSARQSDLEKTPQSTPKKTTAAPSDSSAWKVQVGAFSTKTAADDVARQISKKERRSVTVVSEKKMHRVLVHVGSGSEASALAARMDRSGFPGAFVISPKQQ